MLLPPAAAAAASLARADLAAFSAWLALGLLTGWKVRGLQPAARQSQQMHSTTREHRATAACTKPLASLQREHTVLLPWTALLVYQRRSTGSRQRSRWPSKAMLSCRRKRLCPCLGVRNSLPAQPGAARHSHGCPALAVASVQRHGSQTKHSIGLHT